MGVLRESDRAPRFCRLRFCLFGRSVTCGCRCEQRTGEGSAPPPSSRVGHPDPTQRHCLLCLLRVATRTAATWRNSLPVRFYCIAKASKKEALGADTRGCGGTGTVGAPIWICTPLCCILSGQWCMVRCVFHLLNVVVLLPDASPRVS